ncbi:hypothetical protein ACQKDS_12395 [Serratia sp. NPDC078593]|uniref:hypothetical protein n=1 Tax=unclassified Serratia (in: enterobacteria) TaxID=2647522 RepID=UPI0037D74BB7
MAVINVFVNPLRRACQLILHDVNGRGMPRTCVMLLQSATRYHYPRSGRACPTCRDVAG